MKEEKLYKKEYQVQQLFTKYEESGRSFLFPTSSQLKEIEPFFKGGYSTKKSTWGKYLTVTLRSDSSFLQSLVTMDDEWFIAYIEKPKKTPTGWRPLQWKDDHFSADNPVNIYKCDQFDGLMQCLKDNITI